MPALWEIEPKDIRQLQGDSPEFTAFMNALLQSKARSHGITDDKLRTNVRDNIADGGVDAAVDVVMKNDDTGWFTCATAWQYKARGYAHISDKELTDEIKKTYSKKLIEAGYGYRLAISDGMPDQTKRRWETILATEAAVINPNAPLPAVLTETELRSFANRFPSICIAFFKDHLRSTFLTFNEWTESARAVVLNFVDVLAWQPHVAGIARFADIANSESLPCITVQGEAGVGKTRLVYEGIARIGKATSLVLYTDDQESAERIARDIAADKNCTAILIADECGLRGRVEIEKILARHVNRARVICIDNSALRPATPGLEIMVTKPPREVVEKILADNFAEITSERRRSFAALSGNFVRLAVDLCRRNEYIPEDGDPSKIMTYFQEHYLANRLNEPQLRAIETLSLLTRVGFKGEVAEELDILCKICGHDKAPILTSAKEMKDAPGFVAFGGRFLYITPAIIARAAFLRAWKCHIEDDPDGFLQKVPASLIERFAEQVEKCGTTAMKETVSNFFGHWTSQIVTEDLSNEDKMRKLVQFVEIMPERFLPVLKRLIVDTPIERLKALHSTAGWGSGPRRHIVWFCEKAVIFPDLFEQIEEILLHLSLAESEPSISNNATNIWSEIFRIYLSGTAIAFHDRFRLLARRAHSDDQRVSALALKAIDQILEFEHVSRMSIPAVVMGRIPPEQWRPSCLAEQNHCVALILQLSAELVHSGRDNHAVTIKKMIISHLGNLILYGFLREVTQILDKTNFPEELLPALSQAADFFFEFGATQKDVPSDLVTQVKNWLTIFTPTNTEGRLKAIVGRDPWHHVGRTEELRKEQEEATRLEMVELAKVLISNPELFQSFLPWLSSDHARSAFKFAVLTGTNDRDGSLHGVVQNYLLNNEKTSFCAGYIKGQLETYESALPRITSLIDSISNSHPRAAFEIIAVGGDEIAAFPRVIRLIRDGRLGAEYLRLFEFGVKNRPLTIEELTQVFQLLTRAAFTENQMASRVGIHILWALVAWHASNRNTEIFQNPTTLNEIKAFLLASVKHESDDRPYWGEVVEQLIPFDHKFVIDLALGVLTSQHGLSRVGAEKVLAEAAKNHGLELLRALTPLMSNDNLAWRFHVLKYPVITKALPIDAVNQWLDEVGVAGARILARSLPGPFIDKEGRPTIPEPTLTILTRFGEDDEVYKDFTLGLHSFQTYSGDIAQQHEEEARVATRFINHELPVIQKWAQAEIRTAKYEAQQAKEREEEMFGL